MNTRQNWPPLMADGLSKRYNRGWALHGCSLTVPAHRVVGLVGPNGAGKTTLMSLATGMLRPTAGRVRIFGAQPDGRGTHPGLSFLGQQKPLYRGLTVADTLRFGQRMNPGWDQHYAERLIADAEVPLTAPVGTLSGGQRTRVAIAVALGKRPRLILLDEPLADLDPLARQDTLRILMTEAAGHGITVVLSSHVVAELQGVCDHLILLGAGKVQLTGDIEPLLAGHVQLTGPANGRLAVGGVIEVLDLRNGLVQLLARTPAPLVPAAWTVTKPTVEDLVLAYMRSGSRRAVAA
jgi:ABC-2 type transport system ATP-binding protein